MVEFDDHLIGVLLKTLQQLGFLGKTLVIYTSDHGEMAGEHGLWWKMSFYEGSVGVPLIFWMPRQIEMGTRVTAPVSLIDIAPTLTHMTGAPGIPKVTGDSLLGFLEGEQNTTDRGVFSELLVNPRLWRHHGPSGGPARMLRKGRWKCVYYHKERVELYDMKRDPNEMSDLSIIPTYRDMLDKMIGEILNHWDPEDLIHDMEHRIKERDVRSTPSEREALPGEYWNGPTGYGYVEPA
jgi:choline-sulfatase